MILILICLITIRPPFVTDYVDEIELNHCYDDKGQKKFVQYVFWDYKTDKVVVDWRICRKHVIPLYYDNKYHLIWHDGKYIRQVIAPVYSTTWTNFDPERRNTKKLHPEYRRKLTPCIQPAYKELHVI